MNVDDQDRYFRPRTGERALERQIHDEFNLLRRVGEGRDTINRTAPEHVRKDVRGLAPVNAAPSLDFSGWFEGEKRLRDARFGFTAKRHDYLGKRNALGPIMKPPINTEIFITRDDPRFRRQNVLQEVQVDSNFYGTGGDAAEVMSAVSGRVLCFVTNPSYINYMCKYEPLQTDRPPNEAFKCLINLFRANYSLRQVKAKAAEQLVRHRAASILTLLTPLGVLDQIQSTETNARSYIPAMTGSVLRRGPVYYTGTDSGLINIWALPSFKKARPDEDGSHTRWAPGETVGMERKGLSFGLDQLPPEVTLHLWLVLEPVLYGPTPGGEEKRSQQRVVWRFRPLVTRTDEPLPAWQCTGTLQGRDWYGASVYVGRVLADNDERNYKGELSRALEEIQQLLYGRGMAHDSEPPTDLRHLPSLSHVHIQPCVTLY